MKTHHLFVLIGALIVAASGCDTVSIDAPLGEEVKPKAMHRFVGAWEMKLPEGVSTHGGASPRLHVRQTRNGRLKMGSVQWSNDDQDFCFTTRSVFVTKLGKEFFAHSEDESTPTKDYFFVRIVWRGKDEIEVFPPDYDKLAELLANQSLKGTAESDGQSRSMVLSMESLKKYLADNPDSLDKLFPKPNDDEAEADPARQSSRIGHRYVRVRQATELNQARFSEHYLRLPDKSRDSDSD